jgi:hypothetical protein
VSGVALDGDRVAAPRRDTVPDTGVVHGVVKDHDNDHDGEHLWGIKWDDSTEHHDFTLINMIPSNCVGGRGLTRGVAIAMAPAAGGSGEERSYPRASGE